MHRFFLENVDGSYTGIYCANILHAAIVGYDILTCLIQHYHTLDHAQQLIDCGHVEHVGKHLERSPLIQQYGYDYKNNPLFQQLARTKQIQVINESLHHVEPMARQFERFYCKNHEAAILFCWAFMMNLAIQAMHKSKKRKVGLEHGIRHVLIPTRTN